MTSRLESLLLEAPPKYAVVDLETVLSSEAGRRFVAMIVFDLARLGWRTFDPAIKEGASSAQHMIFLDGMQEVGRWIAYLSRKHCGPLWRQLERERLARDDHDEVTRKQERHHGPDDDNG